MSTLTIVLDQPWRLAAACRETHPKLFFPETKATMKKDQDKAKTICRTCPVQKQCLQFAMDNGIIHGIWGGKSERQRKIMRGEMLRERRRATT